MAHFLKRCRICGIVVNQCRCSSLEKEVELVVCVRCALELAKMKDK